MKTELTRNQKNLLAMTQLDEVNDCWIWRGQISNSGYGRTMIRDEHGTKMVSAQKASYLQFLDEVPDGYLVKQSCGNRLCINPKHLELMAG